MLAEQADAYWSQFLLPFLKLVSGLWPLISWIKKCCGWCLFCREVASVVVCCANLAVTFLGELFLPQRLIFVDLIFLCFELQFSVCIILTRLILSYLNVVITVGGY